MNPLTNCSHSHRRQKASLLFLLLLDLALAPARLSGKGSCLVHLTGPSLSRHFSPYYDRFNDFHLGLGIEAYFKNNHLLLGGNCHFMFNDSNNRTSYWIGVAPDCQGKGVGGALLRESERLIADRGGILSILETSGRSSYDPTRGFYLRMGYYEAARIADFYAPGDDKTVYVKRLAGT